MGGASRGYSTAARAQVGKSYAPSAPRAGQGTPQREAAEGLRLAVVKQLLPGTDREGRGGEGIEPGAWLSLTEMFVWSEGPRTISPDSRSPKGGQCRTLMPRGPRPVVYHLVAVVELAPGVGWSLPCLFLRALLSLVSSFSRLSLSLSLSLTLSLSMRLAHMHRMA